jgi:hypothetical protein
MNGVTFHYFAVPSCRTLIDKNGFVLVDSHDDRGVSTYYLIENRCEPRRPLDGVTSNVEGYTNSSI